MNTESTRSASGRESIDERLRTAILTGQFAPGQVFGREDIATRLGVAGEMVGEALPGLEADGLLATTPEQRYTVMPLDAEEIAELFDLRILVEVELAPHSVRCRRTEDVARARALLAQMNAAQEVGSVAQRDRWCTLNSALHQALLTPAGHRYHAEMVAYTRELVDPYIHLEILLTGDIQEAHREHGRLVEAFAARDAVSFMRTLREHAEHTRRRLLEGLCRSR